MFWTADRRLFIELIERLVLRAVDPAAEVEMGAPLRPRLEFSLECVKAGEELLGLDALCASLCDYRLPLTAKDRDVIVDLAAQWGLDEFDLGCLEQLVTTA